MKKVISALIAAALVCSTALGQRTHKLSPDAANAYANTNLQVLVQWNIPLGPTTAQKIAALGGSVVREMQNVPMGVYSIPASALSALDADSAVRYVSVDRKVHRKLAYSAAAINAPQVWSAGYIGSGIGVAVLDSGIDQNKNLGLKFNKVITYTQDFTGVSLNAPSYGQDWYGHGDHVAGIIASNGNDSLCKKCAAALVGIAPGASLINLKVLDEFGEGTDSQVVAAIDQAITLKPFFNIRVMNLSLGRPVYESYTLDPLCQAAEAAWKAGIVVVTAAGNDGRDNSFGTDGYGTITAPGNDPYVITVGAMKTENTNTRTDDLIASYSSKGPTPVDQIVKPDIVAPGNLVVSLLAQHGTLPLTYPQNAVPLSYYQSNAPAAQPTSTMPAVPANAAQQPPAVNFGPGMSNVYYTLSGTSMATAVVSGAVADLLQAFPKLTPDQVKLVLMQSSYKTFPVSSTATDPVTGATYVDYYDLFTVGTGYLDLEAALAAAPSVPAGGTAMSPSSSYDPATALVTLNYDPSSFWANPSLQGTRCLWGTNVVYSSSTLQGNQAVLSGARCLWGTSARSASGSLWGTTVDSAMRCLWGTSAPSATGSLWGTGTDSSADSLWGTATETSASSMIAGEN